MGEENKILLNHLRIMHNNALDPLRVYRKGKLIAEIKFCNRFFGRFRCMRLLEPFEGFLKNKFNITINY